MLSENAEVVRIGITFWVLGKNLDLHNKTSVRENNVARC